jgi:hypothetical protein
MRETSVVDRLLVGSWLLLLPPLSDNAEGGPFI